MALLVGELYALLLLEKKAFMTGLAEAELAAKKSGSSISSSLVSAGKVVALGLVAMVVGLGAVGVAALGASMEFQKGMANVQTLIGRGSAVDTRIKELGESVKAMSIVTGKSLSDLSRGLYDVIGTFTDTADSAKWLEIAAKAGAAGMSTTHDAILLLSAVTKAYGDTSFEAAQKAADLIFETANLGVTTFPEMAASMGKVLPIASALKVSQEELFGAMAALTGVTGDTALVTTQLRSIMNAFLKPNTLMRKAIEETGFASGQAMVKQVGLSGAMKLIGGTSVTAERGIAAVFGRVEALTAVLALSGAQADDWAWKTDAMAHAAGRTERAFAIQQATVSAMVDRIGAAFGVLAVNIGDKLMPAWSGFLTFVEKAMPTIQDIVISAVNALITGFTIIGGVVGWAVDKIATGWKILGDLGMQGPIIAAAIGLITAAFVAWGIAAAGAAVGVIAATWPVLAVIAVIAVAIKGLQLIFEAFGISGDDIFAWLGKMAQDFAMAFLSVVGSIVNVISMIPGPLQDGANAVKATLDQMHDDVKNWGIAVQDEGRHAGEGFGEGFANGMTAAAPSGGPVLNPYKKAGGDAGQAMLDQLKMAVDGGMSLSEAQLNDLGISLDDALAAGINVGEPEVAAAVKSLVEVFGTSMAGVKEAAKTNGGAAMAEMAKGILAARQAPVDALDTLKTMLKNAMSPVAEEARLIGELTSKTLAKGMRSKDPAVVAQAIATKDLILARLQELVDAGQPLGKKAMALLAKGVKSKDKDIHNAAVAAQKALMKPLNATKDKAAHAGTVAAKAFGRAVEDNIGNFKVVVDISTSYVKAASAKYGPGYASGAWNIKRNHMAFIHQGEMVIPAAAAQRLRQDAHSPSYGSISPMGGGSTQTFHITVNPGNDVSRAAAHRFGQSVLDVVAGGLREQTARGVS